MSAVKKNKGKQSSGVERRIWQRIQCDFPADCSVNGNRWSCKIVDVSERGMGLVSPVKLNKGDMVNIEDPGTKARVVWADEGRAGLEFLN